MELKVYTPEEVAEILKVTRRTVYNWIRSEKIEAKKIGPRWYVTEEALRANFENKD